MGGVRTLVELGDVARYLSQSTTTGHLVQVRAKLLSILLYPWRFAGANVRVMRRLDNTDIRLIKAMITDPRGTVVALAQKLGLSRNTVQARMAGLEAHGALLSFDRRVNPVALGYRLTAFITVHLQQPRLPEIVEQIAQIPEVIEGHGLSGQADLLVRVVAVDAEDLFRVNGKILAVGGVERTETSLAMGELIPFRMDPLLEVGPRLSD